MNQQQQHLVAASIETLKVLQFDVTINGFLIRNSVERLSDITGYEGDRDQIERSVTNHFFPEKVKPELLIINVEYSTRYDHAPFKECGYFTARYKEDNYQLCFASGGLSLKLADVLENAARAFDMAQFVKESTLKHMNGAEFDYRQAFMLEDGEILFMITFHTT